MGVGMGFILLLPPGRNDTELAARCPLNGKARSLQEGIAARLLQAPGYDQGWVLQPPARCISGAGSSPTGHLKVESRGGSVRGSIKVVLGRGGCSHLGPHQLFNSFNAGDGWEGSGVNCHLPLLAHAL